MASLRLDRYRLSRAIMRRFAFLAKNHNFRRHYLGGADEHEDRYIGDGIVVTIWLSYPGLPLVTLARRVPEEATYKYSALTKGPVVKLKRRYYAFLRKNPTRHQSLWAMQAEFADLVAMDVKATIERLEKEPRAQMGQRWALESNRFSARLRDTRARVVGSRSSRCAAEVIPDRLRS